MQEELINQVKQLIIDSLRIEGMSPDDIETDAPLFGEGLGLDSIDALQLVVAMEKDFGVIVPDAATGTGPERSTPDGIVQPQFEAKGKLANVNLKTIIDREGTLADLTRATLASEGVELAVDLQAATYGGEEPGGSRARPDETHIGEDAAGKNSPYSPAAGICFLIRRVISA